MYLPPSPHQVIGEGFLLDILNLSQGGFVCDIRTLLLCF